jgi:hypothetical protein
MNIRGRLANLFAVIMLAVLLTLSASAQISVGPNVQVSKANSTRSHAEVLVAADPQNAKHLLGCSMIQPKEPTTQMYNTLAYMSTDGGATWQSSLEVDRGLLGSGDPACAFGAKGEAYFSTIVSEKGGRLSEDYKSRLAFYRSLDAGKTWSQPVDMLSLDREFITVDTRSDKYKGRIYVHANGFSRNVVEGEEPVDGFLYFHSSDGGQSFSTPTLLSLPRPRMSVGHSIGAILSDGTYVALFWDLKNPDDSHGNLRPTEKSNATLECITSSDGGETFSRAVVAAALNVGYSGAGSLVPSVAIDSGNGPFKDKIYVAWPDWRSGRSEILLISSSDKGKTWSKPIVVNDDFGRAPNEGPDDFMRAIAVNSSGVVGVMWYDRRDNPDDLGYFVRFSASMDGGETFQPSVRVSEAPASFAESNWRISQFTTGGGHPDPDTRGSNFSGALRVDIWPGHTVGMTAAADGKFFPFWVDNRTGVGQIWAAPVSVAGRAYRNGSVELDSWTDATSKLSLQFAHRNYDPKTRTVTVDAYLLNTSNESLHGPVRLRFVSLRSRAGTVTVGDGQGDGAGSGAVIAWQSLPAEGLKPHSVAGPVHLEFHVPRLSELRGSTLDSNPPVLMQFEAKVLMPEGKSPGKSGGER